MSWWVSNFDKLSCNLIPNSFMFICSYNSKVKYSNNNNSISVAYGIRRINAVFTSTL